MVNTGRPSPACKACRARRLKCDQTKPACIKCIKAKRICPGYREPFEVNFRDQTLSTIRKHERANSTQKKADSADRRRGSVRSISSSEDSSESSSCASLSPTTSYSESMLELSPVTAANTFTGFELEPPAINLITLQTSIMQQAQCFFLHNFVKVQSPNPSVNGLVFLEPLIQRTREGSTFHSTFLATAMASMASRPNSGDLVSVARTYYNKAIRQVAKMVQDREKSKEDELLASVIMLIMYEALMWEDDATPGILNFHLKGAQAIVKLRGPQKQQSPMGYAMFEFIRSFVIHQYAHSPHNGVDEIKWWVHEGSSTDNPRHVLQRLNVETIILRRQLSEFLETDKDSTHSPTAFRLYRKAKKLDKEIAKWFEMMEDTQPWHRQVGMWQEEVPEQDIHKAEAYPGKIYSFTDILVATKFLNAHVHRLMLAEIMAKIVDWVQNHCSPDVMTDPQRDEAVTLAHDQITEILAMTPCFCNWPNYKSPSPYGGMACSFQLYITGMSTFVSPKQKAFLMGRLAYIATSSGLKLAARFAHMMESIGSRDHIYTKFKDEYLNSVRKSAVSLGSPVPTGFQGITTVG